MNTDLIVSFKLGDYSVSTKIEAGNLTKTEIKRVMAELQDIILGLVEDLKISP